MKEQRSRPGEKAATPDENHSQNTAYPPQIVLSSAAESYMDNLADDIAAGIVASHQLSPALRKMWWLAFYAGHAAHDAACQPQLERLQWERDLWYFVANNKGKRPADFYAAQTAALWAEASA